MIILSFTVHHTKDSGANEPVVISALDTPLIFGFTIMCVKASRKFYHYKFIKSPQTLTDPSTRRQLHSCIKPLISARRQFWALASPFCSFLARWFRPWFLPQLRPWKARKATEQVNEPRWQKDVYGWLIIVIM